MDQRRIRALTKGIAMDESALLDEIAIVLQFANDGFVRVFAEESFEFRDRGTETRLIIEGVDEIDARRATDPEIVFAVGGGDVNDACALLRGHEGIFEYDEAIRLVRKV